MGGSAGSKSFSQIMKSKVCYVKAQIGAQGFPTVFRLLFVSTNRVAAGGDRCACNWLTQTQPALVNGEKVSVNS